MKELNSPLPLSVCALCVRERKREGERESEREAESQS